MYVTNCVASYFRLFLSYSPTLAPPTSCFLFLRFHYLNSSSTAVGDMPVPCPRCSSQHFRFNIFCEDLRSPLSIDFAVRRLCRGDGLPLPSRVDLNCIPKFLFFVPYQPHTFLRMILRVSYTILPYVSYHVLYYLNIPCPMLLTHIIMFHPILSCHIPSYPIFLCHILSFPLLSHIGHDLIPIFDLLTVDVSGQIYPRRTSSAPSRSCLLGGICLTKAAGDLKPPPIPELPVHSNLEKCFLVQSITPHIQRAAFRPSTAECLRYSWCLRTVLLSTATRDFIQIGRPQFFDEGLHLDFRVQQWQKMAEVHKAKNETKRQPPTEPLRFT